MREGPPLLATVIAVVVVGGVAIVWSRFAASLAPFPDEPRVAECETGEGVAELARVASPGGARSAIVLQTNGGATTAFGAEICVEERGRRRLVGVGYPSNRARVIWDSAARLRIHELSDGRPDRVVDVTSGEIVCEPVRKDWGFCAPDGRRPRR